MQLSEHSSRTLLIRADASQEIGTGHIFRCLALADEARARGARVFFISQNVLGNLGGLLSEKGYQTYWIPDSDAWDADADAKATQSIIADLNSKIDWILVDHYKLDAQWEASIRPLVGRLAVIDDLADRPHAADLLIDYSHGIRDLSLYDNLLPTDARRALGPAYTLLRREFFETKRLSRKPSAARRILVTLGGNDPLNTTEMVLDALDCSELSHLSIDVTLGTSNPRLTLLQRKIAGMPNVTPYVQHSRMADLMMRADLCIGAGGTTALERCYLGLPSLILVLADNQQGVAAALHEDGCARNLGFVGDMTVEGLRYSISNAVSDIDWLEQSSRRGEERVDGKGVFRVLDLLSIVQPLSLNGPM